MPTLSQRFGNFLNIIESRWSLYALIQASGVVASFGLPAWAVRSTQIFSEYAPVSWVAAGFAGILVWSSIRALLAIAKKISIKNRFDELILQKGAVVNALETTFQRQRIFLNDFVLPSHTVIDGKTFIDCDIVGPATLYFAPSNQAQTIRPPKIDAIWLGPKATFSNGFIVTNCIFKNCSFQRITIFASINMFHTWKDNANLNWIGLTPSEEDIMEFDRTWGRKEKGTQTAEPKLLAPKPQEADNRILPTEQ